MLKENRIDQMVVGGVSASPLPDLAAHLAFLLSSRSPIAMTVRTRPRHTKGLTCCMAIGEERMAARHCDLLLTWFWAFGVLVCWQPAHMCKVLEHGDEIIQIDGYDTPTKEAIMPLLRGSDVPGSKVDITVKRV
jgi:hypothetical protein